MANTNEEYNSAYKGPEIDAAVGAVRSKETQWDNKASMEQVTDAIAEAIYGAMEASY